jgi:hypothetical protein
MRLGAIPQNFKESIALAAGLVPTPLMDTLVALLLAKTVITATALGIFDVLEGEPLTAADIAERCESDPKATEKLVRALFACKYLKYRENRFTLARVSRRWLSRKASSSLHSAILHRTLDLRFMKNTSGTESLKTFTRLCVRRSGESTTRGQANHAAQMTDEVIERIPLPPHAADLLDLGGGHGLYAISFCRRYRSLPALVFSTLRQTSGSSKQSGRRIAYTVEWNSRWRISAPFRFSRTRPT